MPVHARRTVGRRIHRGSVSGIVCKSAYLIGEVDAEVKAVESECSAESSVDIRNRVSAEIVSRTRILCGGDAPSGRIAGIVNLIHIPKSFTLVGYSCELLHIEGIDRKAFTEECCSAHISLIAFNHPVAALLRQHGNLVLEVSEIHVDVPLNIAALDRSEVQFQFYTAVAHVTHIGIVRRVSH